jgi:hypothetical protein
MVLKRRAVCEASVEKLMRTLTSMIEEGIYEADVTNRDYLKLFGTHLDDGRSAERAMSLMRHLVGKVPQVDAPTNCQ